MDVKNLERIGSEIASENMENLAITNIKNNEASDGIKLVLSNGENLSSLIKKAQDLSLELSKVTKQIEEFSPVWQLVSMKQE